MKKVLALVVAFAVCFTAIAGCLAVSAESTTPVITIEKASVEAAGGNATFTVSGTGYSEKYAQILAITVPAGLTVSTIDELEEYDAEDQDPGDFDWARSTVDGATVIKILKIIDAATFTYTVNVVAPANETAEAVVYDITATVEAAKWQEEAIVDVTVNAGSLTVAAAGSEEPVLDNSLASAVYQKQILITNKVGVYFTLYMPGADYDDFEFVVTKKSLNDRYEYGTDDVETIFNTANCTEAYAEYDMYTISYTDIALYEMNLEFNTTLYLIKGGKRVAYYTYDPDTLSNIVQAYYTANESDAVKAGLSGALLNLGTYAQQYFGFTNGSESSPLRTFPLPNEIVDQSKVPAAGSLTEIAGQRDSQITVAMMIKAAPSFYYTVYDADRTDASALTLRASYASVGMGGDVVMETVASDLPAEDREYGSYGLFSLRFDKVALYDADKTVTMTATYDDGTVYTHEYSLLSLVAANASATGYAGQTYNAIASVAAAAHAFWPTF